MGTFSLLEFKPRNQISSLCVQLWSMNGWWNVNVKFIVAYLYRMRYLFYELEVIQYCSL